MKFVDSLFPGAIQMIDKYDRFTSVFEMKKT